jgi:hypothetical protein
VPPHPFRGGHRLRVQVTNVTHIRNGSARAGLAAHSFFHSLNAANSTTAFDKIRIVSATALSKAAGLVIVGFCGHLIKMAGRDVFGRFDKLDG